MSEQSETAPEPRANPNFRGHAEAEKALLDGYRSGRLAHAWLLTGRKGIGKATLAYRFARYVLASSRERRKQGQGGLFAAGAPAAAPSGLHLDPSDPVFRRIAAGAHADFASVEIGIDPKNDKRRSEIIVDDVREIGGFMRLTPAEGGWRVVVIDSADDMNRNAANAVLKVLEEPPARALLLLVSHAPGRLLPTIRSRCRKLALRPLDAATVTALLADHRPDLSAADAATLVAISQGSIGRSIAMAESDGTDLHRRMAGLFATLPTLDAGELHGFADRLARAGGEGLFELWAELVRQWLSRLIRAKVGAGPSESLPDQRLAGLASLERWLAVWEKIDALLAGTDEANLDRRQVVLNVFLAIEGAVRV